ncbi:MAG: hypothetical protein GC138_04455 [Gammaproteobacteria bacterium]|nr:hypothetical protein [Gammaproteobacteria bacterium]
MRRRTGGRAVLAALLLCGSALPAWGGQWLDGWRQTEAMSTARAGAAAVEGNGVIYVLGGVDGVDFLSTTEWTRIKPDGEVESWRSGPSMQTARGFFAAVAVNGWLYAVGGGNGPHGKHLLASVERAKIQSNGALGPWQTEPQTLSRPRRCAKVEAIDGWLYAIGGFDGNLLDTVERAKILPDGGLGPWQVEEGRLTMPRYIHSAERIDGALYVVGGHNEREGTGLRAVEVARPDQDHGLGQWQSLPALEHGRYGLATAADREFLYALGGLDGAIYSDAVEVAEVQKDGGLAPWRAATALSSPRANLSTVVAEHRLYVIGGTNRDGYFRTVEYADIQPDGRLGVTASDEEARGYRLLKETQHAVREQPLPRSGDVLDVIQAGAYTYIQVREDGQPLWIAAPSMEIKVGDRLGFSRGLTMQGFHSRTLNRDFDVILFVENAVKAR